MCCIHNLHERLSIIFIQSINLLVFPLPPVSYPPALISCCRFRLSACSCLSFCLVLRRKITAECLELWGWRRCARWPVFKMHARPPQLGRASPLSVVEIRQAGWLAGRTPSVHLFSFAVSFSHYSLSLPLSTETVALRHHPLPSGSNQWSTAKTRGCPPSATLPLLPVLFFFPWCQCFS